MRSFFTILAFCAASWAYSQSDGLIHHFTFNNCEIEDNITGERGSDVLFTQCECGVDGRSLDIQNPDVTYRFPSSITQQFSADFTFSFYMWPRNTIESNDAIDIWSAGPECNSDTTFQVRYFPSEEQLRIRFSYQNRNTVDLIGFLDGAFCWSYVVITKQGQDFSLYIDNQLVSEDFLPGIGNFSTDSPLFLSRGLCIDLPFIRAYEGYIDELRIYDRALSESEIIQENFFPNQLILDDQVIFKGQSVFLENGGFCSDDFTWSPTTALSDPNSREPVATPEVTTTYTLSVNDRGCQTTDEIQIVVVDAENLDCSDLLIPSAFTPNGDGLNDDFGLSNPFILDELLSFEVFDKWGGRLFYATRVNNTWNGRAQRGNDLGDDEYVMPGPYVYRIRYICQGEENQLNGIVNVIR